MSERGRSDALGAGPLLSLLMAGPGERGDRFASLVMDRSARASAPLLLPELLAQSGADVLGGEIVVLRPIEENIQLSCAS